MPIQCRMIDREAQIARGEQPAPGDMWFLPGLVEGDPAHVAFCERHLLSPEYLRDWKGRRYPLCVVLPSGRWFNVDSRSDDRAYGWTVTGEPPLITVHPSIHAVGEYHGWLRDGVLSDDIDGRTYGALADERDGLEAGDARE